MDDLCYLLAPHKAGYAGYRQRLLRRLEESLDDLAFS